jgi:hypothetical protein
MKSDENNAELIFGVGNDEAQIVGGRTDGS